MDNDVKTCFGCVGAIVLFVIVMVAIGRSEPVQWSRAEREDKRVVYKEFIESFPDSSHVDQARRRIAELDEEEKELWESMQETSSVPMIEDFVERFPDSVHFSKAQNLLEEAMWKAVVRSPSESTIDAYLDEFPEGRYAALARRITREETRLDGQESRHKETSRWQDVREMDSEKEVSVYESVYEQVPEAKNR